MKSNIVTKDYLNTIDIIYEKIKKFPKQLIPKVIIHNGHIKHPGISDLDLIFGFDDTFLNANYFLKLLKIEINKIPNSHIFFHHLPHIYPESALELLPLMTYNPKDELNIINGQIDFVADNQNEYQIVLNSFEQIHNRIAMLAIFFFQKTKNLNSLLLIGHSILHSINCANKLGAVLIEEQFIHLQEIEKFRKKISDGAEELIINNIDILTRGLINECYEILKFLNKKIGEMILIHFSKNHQQHHYNDMYVYSENIFFTGMSKSKDKILFNLNENHCFIQAFGWQTICIYENYFLENNLFKSIFLDSTFEHEIEKRKNFIEKLIKFNFKNFNNATGRNAMHPMVKGIRYDFAAKKKYF